MNTLVEMDYLKASTPISENAIALRESAKVPTEDGKDGVKGLATGRQDMFLLSPYALSIKPGWNSRDPKNPANAEHIDWLARSIVQEGVKEPLTVVWEDGKAVVTDGHCRLLATFRAIEVYGAEIKALRVKTEPRGATEADRLLSQIVRNSGKSLEPIEYATVLARLETYGWTVEEMAKRCAISESRVRQLLELHSAPGEIKKMIVDGEVSPSLAGRVISSSATPAKAVETIKAAVKAAKQEGKTKATPRHVDAAEPAGKKHSLKLQIKAIFDRAASDGRVEDLKNSHVVSFTDDEFDTLRDLLGL